MDVQSPPKVMFSPLGSTTRASVEEVVLGMMPRRMVSVDVMGGWMYRIAAHKLYF